MKKYSVFSDFLVYLQPFLGIPACCVLNILSGIFHNLCIEMDDNIICYNCREQRHIKQYCKKLHNCNKRTQASNIVAATVSSSSERTVIILADEYTKFI